MKYLVQLCLVLGVFFVLSAMSGDEATAQDTIPDCINSEKWPTKDADGIAWWNRRTPEQKKYIRELPCDERYIPMVCVFLWEPDLRGCTNKGVAEFRADRACAAKGHALLSEAHVACKEEFKKTFTPPFPGSTS